MLPSTAGGRVERLLGEEGRDAWGSQKRPAVIIRRWASHVGVLETDLLQDQKLYLVLALSLQRCKPRGEPGSVVRVVAGRAGGDRDSAAPAVRGPSSLPFAAQASQERKRRVRRGQVMTLMYNLRKYRNTGSIRWVRPRPHLFILA